MSWEPARVIYTPAPSGGGTGVSQTIGNRIVVRPDGTLVNLFTQIDTVAGQSTRRLGVIGSADKGSSWSAPVFIAELRSVGTRDAASGKAVRDAKLKGVQAQIQGDQLRVSGKKRDDLQAVIALLKERDFGIALQFVNYR